MMKYWTGVLMVFGTVVLGAQEISGTVYDQVSRAVLPGATVSLSGTGTGVAANEEGFYTLAGLEPGRYRIVISYVGYTSTVFTDVWVKAGKVTRQDVYLERNSSSLDEVVVSADISITEPGRIGITEEQINRFAATYYDPARLVTSSPDVAVTNDQNNQVSVRGISPDYNTWRLEGAEIVNPNHLSNAGTFLDQPSATGGGVNILSAQMLGRSEFLYSTFSSEYSNSVGGIFDMYMKEGNTAQRQYTAQASLIGLDLATEGPFSKKGMATYAANYRYSFTGLLTQFGVDFGGESIGFQDLSLSISTPLGERSQLKVFGTGGLSFNDFEHRSFGESEVYKDRNDIFYANKTGLAGMSLKTGFNNSNLTNSLVFSGYENSREQHYYDENDDLDQSQTYENGAQITSLHTRYMLAMGGARLTTGMLANLYKWKGGFTGVEVNTEAQVLVNPYAQLETRIFSKLSGTMGLGYMQTDGDNSIDPRISLTYQLNAGNYLTGAAGKYAQVLSPDNYAFSDPSGTQVWGADYDLLESYRVTLAHLYEKSGFNLYSELFHYHYPEVNAGTERSATTMGASVSSEKSYSGDFYFRMGGSLFQSEISGNPRQHYNTNYNVSLAAGKEWDRSTNSKNKRLSVNLRGLYQGGRYYDIVMPFTPGVEVTPENYRTDPYLRVDLRVMWARYRENRTTSVSLDLQNVAGIQNEAYRYYDGFTDQLETQYQLGLIPILTYRVEW